MPDYRVTCLTLRRGVLWFITLWFAIGGVCHFIFASAFVRIVPPVLPLHYAIVYISGFFELLGVLGLIVPGMRRYAGWGLVILTVAVTPANVFMWEHAALFPSIPPWLLFARLPFQALLVTGIVWATERDGECIR